MSKKWALLLLALMMVYCQKNAPPVNEIHISIPYDLDSLDPHARNTISNYVIASHFYEGLVATDGDWKVKPALARSWENPDLYTWIFHLEPNARFHSGKPLQADDVVYSFQRLLADPDLEMRDYLTNVLDIAALDPHRIRIRTKKPAGNLLNQLSLVHIVPAGSTSEMLKRQVTGTGPYRLVKWKKGEWIHMVRNENYWKNVPFFRSVVFHLNQTPQQATKALRSKSCQLIQSNAKTLGLTAKTSSDYQVLLQNSIFVKFLSFDLIRQVTPYCSAKKNPFKNILVRQAIHYAIDRKTLIENLPTYAIPATQPVAPFVFGYNPEIREPLFDPTKAKFLLAQAGYPDGFTVVLHARNLFPEAAANVQQQLARIGIRVEVKLMGTSAFYDALLRKETSFYLTGIGAPTGDGGHILEMALHSPDPDARMGGLNYGGYSNPELDKDIEFNPTILNMKNRREHLRTIMTHIMQDLPWIPLYVDQTAFAIDRTLFWKPRNDSYIFAYEIHKNARPGFLETIYHRAGGRSNGKFTEAIPLPRIVKAVLHWLIDLLQERPDGLQLSGSSIP